MSGTEIAYLVRQVSAKSGEGVQVSQLQAKIKHKKPLFRIFVSGLRFLVLDSALQYAPESLDSDARTTSCVSAYHDRRASPNMAVGRYLCHA